MLVKVADTTLDEEEFEEKEPLKALPSADESESARRNPETWVKFEVYGQELVEKEVKKSGNSGRVYLPPNWVGHHVKIVRID